LDCDGDGDQHANSNTDDSAAGIADDYANFTCYTHAANVAA
jgi:hypothetical protein